jgi:hypothetical protein
MMKRGWRHGKIGLIVLCAAIVMTAPVPAQSVRVGDAGLVVYQQLPELPQANQYIDRETKQVDANNTFVSRLISYHLYSKGRPAFLRLDWKHTMADYLGANEDIDPERYPTQKRLQTNPLEDDRAVLQKLTRAQRDQLIQVLIATLGTPAPTPSVAPTPTPTPSVAPMPTPPPSTIPVRPTPRTAPQPGGAALLK